MKTSSTQFQMMVSFMEQNGDIHKPIKDTRGRIQNIKDWDKLTNLLNSDPTGDRKTTEKWKKVWSDLKNNTKKKAAKINKAAHGTARQAKLSDVEQQVLNIMGIQAATGFLGVDEAGFTQEQGDRWQSIADEAAVEHFCESDEKWRNFLKQKHDDEQYVERERVRIREMELQIQEKWQAITIKALDLINNIVITKL